MKDYVVTLYDCWDNPMSSFQIKADSCDSANNLASILLAATTYNYDVKGI